MNDVQRVSWPGWETVGLIGRGNFGAVYEIQRNVLGNIEKEALKVISIPQNESDIDEMYSNGYDDESIADTVKGHLNSIVAEYSLMRKMRDCANVVHCDDVSYVRHDNGIGWDIFIKMELLTPLAKALPTEIPEDTVIKIAKDICAALVFCKRHNIVHRDIKPQNIFVSENGDYKLGDFGIAKTVEHTMSGTKIGTYKYMAPEVYSNQPYGSAADIYSLGLVLYWLLNERRLPFWPLPPQRPNAVMEEEAKQRRLSGETIPPPAHGSEVLKRIVLKACAFDPAARYASAEEMLSALNAHEQNTVRQMEQPPQVIISNANTPSAIEPQIPEMELLEELERLNRECGKSLPKPIPAQESPKSAIVVMHNGARKWRPIHGTRKWRPILRIVILIICLMAVFLGCIVCTSWSGWIDFRGERYYIDNGELASGWMTIEEKRYYFGEDGVMQTGISAVDGVKYHFGEDGVMQAGMVFVGTSKYYFNADGSQHTGWITLGEKTYYCSPANDGAVAVGKWEIGGQYYYFDSAGVMATGRREIREFHSGTIDTYYFTDDGCFRYKEITNRTSSGAINSSWSDTRVTFPSKNGGEASGVYKKLNSSLENCIRVVVRVTIAEVSSGNADGQWQVHVRTETGQWKSIGFFNVKNGLGQLAVTLEEPTTFDAFVCTAYDARWSGKFAMELPTATWRSNDFGEVSGKE